MTTTLQLTLDVAMPPEARSLSGGGMLVASLALDAIPVDRDLNYGDQITVTVAGPDGEVLGQMAQEISGIGFKPLVMDKQCVGLERAHKAKAAA